MARTSISDPLKIAEIPFLGGTIGITFCPGKKGASVFGAPWDRDLTMDLDVISAWGATQVITLIEDKEFMILGVPNLPTEMENRFKWHHIPITDLEPPSGAAEQMWAYLSPSFVSALKDGEKLLIHCRGGLGRAGTMAARLLMDGGMSAKVAIDAVRAVRPNAIETKPQEEYLHRHPTFLSHASMIGTAIGDALGAKIEFKALSEINEIFPNGVDRLLPAYGKHGAITDDTQMALFTAAGLIKAHERLTFKGVCDPASMVHEALMDWFLTQGGKPNFGHHPDKDGLVNEPALHAVRAPGNTCLSALSASKFYGDKANNDSKGCGTIMRVGPIAFSAQRETVRQLAIDASALTHGHITGQLAAAFWAELLADVLNGSALEAACKNLLDQYRGIDGADEVVQAVEMALAAPRNGSARTVEGLGGGWIAEECLAIALYAALSANTATQAFSIAVRHSGDSDSCGAVAGSLLGLLYPEEVLNSKWAREIELTDIMTDISKSLANRDLPFVEEERLSYAQMTSSNFYERLQEAALEKLNRTSRPSPEPENTAPDEVPLSAEFAAECKELAEAIMSDTQSWIANQAMSDAWIAYEREFTEEGFDPLLLKYLGYKVKKYWRDDLPQFCCDALSGRNTFTDPEDIGGYDGTYIQNKSTDHVRKEILSLGHMLLADTDNCPLSGPARRARRDELISECETNLSQVLSVTGSKTVEMLGLIRLVASDFWRFWHFMKISEQKCKSCDRFSLA